MLAHLPFQVTGHVLPHFTEAREIRRNSLLASVDLDAPAGGDRLSKSSVRAGRRLLKLGHDIDDAAVPYEKLPHRILKTLEQLAQACGPDRKASVSREITKLHEETIRGSLQELIAHFSAKAPRGEFVLVVSGQA